MARFFTPKYLKHAGKSGTIEEDRACRRCGYNLRGLAANRPCPECGGLASESLGLVDVLGGGDRHLRHRLRLGLGLLALCLAATIVNRTGLLLIAFGVPGGGPRFYLTIGVVLVQVTQPLWLVAYIFWAAHVLMANPPGWWVAAHLLLRLIAGAGALVLAWILAFLASEAEIEIAHRRLNTAIWMLPLAALPPLLFVGPIPWFAIVLLGIFLAFWFWALACYLLGVWHLHRYAHWSLMRAASEIGRQERIAELRDEIDREVEAKIRPIPKDE
jgi:hypothetical protein